MINTAVQGLEWPLILILTPLYDLENYFFNILINISYHRLMGLQENIKDKKFSGFLYYLNIELIVWIAALLYLGIGNFEQGSQFSFCPLHNLGIHFCPGCGIGRSISFLLHGNFLQSIHTHWLGPLAFVIICMRLIQLIRFTFFKKYFYSI